MKPIEDILNEAANGSFVDTATTAQLLKAVIRRGKNWEGMGPAGKEALEQVMTLLARILTGNATDAQYWIGAAAYLQHCAQNLGVGVEGDIERITRRLKTDGAP
jgi:hypothetical protein